MTFRIHPNLVLHVVVLFKCPAYHVGFLLQLLSSQSHSSVYLRVKYILGFHKLGLSLRNWI